MDKYGKMINTVIFRANTPVKASLSAVDIQALKGALAREITVRVLCILTSLGSRTGTAKIKKNVKLMKTYLFLSCKPPCLCKPSHIAGQNFSLTTLYQKIYRSEIS